VLSVSSPVRYSTNAINIFGKNLLTLGGQQNSSSQNQFRFRQETTFFTSVNQNIVSKILNLDDYLPKLTQNYLKHLQ